MGQQENPSKLGLAGDDGCNASTNFAECNGTASDHGQATTGVWLGLGVDDTLGRKPHMRKLLSLCVVALVSFITGCCHDTCDSCRDICDSCGKNAVHLSPAAAAQQMPAPAEKK